MCKLSGYGLSTDAIADVLDKDSRTIATWQRGVANKSNRFHDVVCLSITLTVLFIQMDELWSFLRNKNNPLWVFVGFEVDSRFWMNFELGSRTTHTATKLVKRLKDYIGIPFQGTPLKVIYALWVQPTNWRPTKTRYSLYLLIRRMFTCKSSKKESRCVW
jgi:hypothetical protein